MIGANRQGAGEDDQGTVQAHSHSGPALAGPVSFYRTARTDRLGGVQSW